MLYAIKGVKRDARKGEFCGNHPDGLRIDLHRFGVLWRPWRRLIVEGRMAALNKELDPRFAKVFGAVAGAIGFLVLYLFFASLGKLVPAHSDSSYLILYADAMLNGNWGLRGWDLTTVSFYTELPFYLVAVKWMGVKPDLIRLVPAFIYALNTALVCALAWKFRIIKTVWIFLPVVAYLILPSNGIWPFALNGAIHMVTLTVGLCMLLVLNDRLILATRARTSLLFL